MDKGKDFSIIFAICFHVTWFCTFSSKSVKKKIFMKILICADYYTIGINCYDFLFHITYLDHDQIQGIDYLWLCHQLCILSCFCVAWKVALTSLRSDCAFPMAAMLRTSNWRERLGHWGLRVKPKREQGVVVFANLISCLFVWLLLFFLKKAKCHVKCQCNLCV